MSKNSNNEEAFINEMGETVLYKNSSQATYYFDCTGDGKSKGSFCCILKKDTEYFILTAGHNLQNGNNEKTSTTKGSVYKLINDANNFVELELIKDYTNDGYDAAVLKINTPNITSNDFYVNAIEFETKFCYDTGDFDYKNESKNTIKTKNGTYVGYSNKIESDFKFLGYQKSEQLYYINDKGKDQMSGCCVFENENKNLLGLFKGEKNGNGVVVTYFDLKLEASNYEII